MLPLSKAQAWLAHSIIIPREASENVESVVRMIIAFSSRYKHPYINPLFLTFTSMVRMGL